MYKEDIFWTFLGPNVEAYFWREPFWKKDSKSIWVSIIMPVFCNQAPMVDFH